MLHRNLPPMLEQDQEEEPGQDNDSLGAQPAMKTFAKKPKPPMGMMKRAGSKAVLNPGVPPPPKPKLDIKAPPTIREESNPDMLAASALLSSATIGEEEETIQESDETVSREPSNDSITPSRSASNTIASNEGGEKSTRREGSMPRGGAIRQGSTENRTASQGGAQAARKGSVIGHQQSSKSNVKRRGSMMSTGSSRSSSMMRGSSKMGSMSMRRRSRSDAMLITVHTLEGKDDKFVANILNSLIEDFKAHGPNDRSLRIELDDDSKRWQCPACAKLFVQESNVFAHIQNSHLSFNGRMISSHKTFFGFDNKATELQNKIDQVFDTYFKTAVVEEESDVEDDELALALEAQMLKLERLVTQDQQPVRSARPHPKPAVARAAAP